MVTPRFVLLYPRLLQAVLPTEIGPIRTCVRHRSQCQRSLYTTFAACRAELRSQKHDTSTEPPAPLSAGPGSAEKRQKSSSPAAPAERAESPAELPTAPTDGNADQAMVAESATSEDADEGEPNQPYQNSASEEPETIELPPPGTPPPPNLSAPPSKPLETILEMPPPSEVNQEDKPPHLAPPRYVHHFDTWSLVCDLEKGGFNKDSSVTLMKAVRGILLENMELARRGLVSKSNVENETYLFRAACSELKTEIQNNRTAEMEKLRAQRTQLQHEVDILNIKFGQEMANMKDAVKGMFDDRKMAVKMEQRNFESKIQELNYKIQVVLNSDARTQVEGIRWVLTRRAAGALAVAVVMILSALNYSRYMTQTQERERKKHEELMVKSDTAMMSGDSVGKAVENGGDDEALLAGEGVTTA